MSAQLEQLSAVQNWREVSDWGERWLALGSAPEAAYRALMQAHVELGDPAGALAIFQRCVEALRAELGVAPSAETLAVQAMIRVRAEGPWLSLPVHPNALIGRDRELAEIAALLDDPACRLLTLLGPGGIGKTRLALQGQVEHRVPQTNGVSFAAGR